MYREPHLQRKSNQCAILWKEWFNYKYGLKDEEKAKELRKNGVNVYPNMVEW